MNLLVKRTDKSSISTIGELSIGGIHQCYTLEPPVPIPAATYNLTIRWSNRFARLMPHVENVHGHQGIEIHWGNWAKDTQLCTLVGETKSPQVNFIGESRKAFDALFALLSECHEEMSICYAD